MEGVTQRARLFQTYPNFFIQQSHKAQQQTYLRNTFFNVYNTKDDDWREGCLKQLRKQTLPLCQDLCPSGLARFFLRTRFGSVGVSGEGVISSPRSDALADVFRRRHGNVELDRSGCGEMLSADNRAIQEI